MCVVLCYLQTVVCRCAPAPLWPSSLLPQPSSPPQQWALGTLDKKNNQYFSTNTEHCKSIFPLTVQAEIRFIVHNVHFIHQSERFLKGWIEMHIFGLNWVYVYWTWKLIWGFSHMWQSSRIKIKFSNKPPSIDWQLKTDSSCPSINVILINAILYAKFKDAQQNQILRTAGCHWC